MKSREEIIIKELESRKKTKCREKKRWKEKEKAKAACTHTYSKRINFKHAYLHKGKHAINIMCLDHFAKKF